MAHEFDAGAQMHVNRDEGGLARDLLNTENFFESKARTAQLAAREYLERFGGMLGIAPDELRHLGLRAERRPIEQGIEYRFLAEAPQFDATTVSFTQTALGVPVWEAGLAISMLQSPFRVTSARSTLHREVRVSLPGEEALERLHRLSEVELSRALGLTERAEGFHRKSMKIERRAFYVYRYREEDRTRSVEAIEGPTPRQSRPGGDGRGNGHGGGEGEARFGLPPLPPVPKRIEEGGHYVVSAITFALGVPLVPDLRWVALVEAETRAVLRLRPMVDSVDGLVFVQDPVTTAGGPLPTASDTALNPLRSAVLLRGLNPPGGGTFALTGDIIALKDVEPPPVAPPNEAPGTDFDFDARTNDFAAVNAYYHTDRFFRLVRELGFDLHTYCSGTVFPTTVDHRGMGTTVNAHCVGNGAFGILRTAFALADLSNLVQPLGLACDWRVVLHELGGHGILYNHVNSPNFGFSHSAGDSFAAMLNDPDSAAPDRFVTFPWENSVIGRRHDRTPAAGFGWSGAIALGPFGPLDLGGYNNEQILSTTHFRIYRSLGGDSTELAVRDFAARYVSYLILRTVGALTAATNPPNAASYSAGLMTADFGSWTTHHQIGGCYWKVIRWAFEKQGLFQPVAKPKPNNDPGSPPPVDVYIDDGRGGEYDYVAGGAWHQLQRFWETTEIWNRHHPDGHGRHQTPVVGARNYAYVRVKNRGTQAAHDVEVRGWHCRPCAGLVWPDDWKPMTTVSRTVPSLAPGAEAVVGPFEWRPEVTGHECMLMGVSAAGDRANNDPAGFLPAAAGPTPVWRLVPNDNNLGLRALVPVPGGGHRRALVRAFRHRRFWACNPFEHPAKMEVRAILPAFLAGRGWSVHLDNPGGGHFTLGDRNSRIIRPRLVSGQDFTAAEVVAAAPVDIEFVVLADGLVVGGITYRLDPELHEPARELAEEEREERHREEERHEHGEEHGREEERRERPRRLHFDIDIG